jgi:hypothetical protein
MSNVGKLIKDLWALDQDIEKVENQLSRMKAKRAMLATVDIPEAMTELGSSNFTTEDHFRCEVKYKIYGSLPSRENPDARYAAIDYLKEHGAGGLIRSNVVVSFGKGDISAANRFGRFLKKHTNEPITVDSEVHPMSLQAWGRQKVSANEPIDLAIVGLRGMTMADVKKLEK